MRQREKVQEMLLELKTDPESRGSDEYALGKNSYRRDWISHQTLLTHSPTDWTPWERMFFGWYEGLRGLAMSA